jgi:N utilization substance protein B
MRILYEAEVSKSGVDAVAESTFAEVEERAAVKRFARALALGYESAAQEIDDRIRAAAANWSLERMASIDRNLLRVALAELLGFPETDARVVIDEAVSIANRFGTDQSGRFVNGILDRIARELRAHEFSGERTIVRPHE